MSGTTMDLLGVNLAGADFGSPGQAYGVGYTYPTTAEIAYESSKGMNVIRLPFLWERLQPTLDGPLNSAELQRIDQVVNYATSKGMKVVLDVHNYGKYNGQLIGSGAVPNSAFANLWSQIAAHFAANPNVIFGLMNEPGQPSATGWLQSVNAAIAAIRSQGATQEVLVPGINYDGAWTWTTSQNAAVLGSGVVDPAGNYAFEVHQYLDSDGSGTHANVVSTQVGVQRLQAVTQWAESTNNRLFLGEFGVASDPTSLAAMQNMLSYMDQHTGAWQGATYWAAGPWWGNYMYSAEPSNGVDAPQMTVLDQFTASAATDSASPATAAAEAPAATSATAMPADTSVASPQPTQPAGDPASVAASAAAQGSSSGTPSVTPLGNGGSMLTFSDGSNTQNGALAAYQERLDAAGNVVAEIADNADGTHQVTGLTGGLRLLSRFDETMTAGGTNETFVFRPQSGQDLVTDFIAGGAGHDVLSFSSQQFASLTDLLAHTSMVDGNAVIQAGPHTSVTVVGVSKQELASHPLDFHFHN